MNLSIEELARTKKVMEELFPEPIDDCAWMQSAVWNHIKLYMSMAYSDNFDHIKLTFSGMKVFIDDELDGVVQTGTYAMVDGKPKKVVRHEFFIKKD